MPNEVDRFKINAPDLAIVVSSLDLHRKIIFEVGIIVLFARVLEAFISKIILNFSYSFVLLAGNIYRS